jgi:hypothetical protein
MCNTTSGELRSSRFMVIELPQLPARSYNNLAAPLVASYLALYSVTNSGMDWLMIQAMKQSEVRCSGKATVRRRRTISLCRRNSAVLSQLATLCIML